MSNGDRRSRGSSASLEKQMAAYDRLPKSVRQALQDSVANWAAYPIRMWWERGDFYDAASLVRRIETWNAHRLEKYARAREREQKRPSQATTGRRRKQNKAA